ncbi:MAG: HAMP domain-containing sensor histidine kinase [Gemmatimonadota bacterium]|jgi:signal transduction histidine kinase/tetratricopeptide (TPR) repeat protein
MQAPGDARKRILLLFFLGIALPSFLLGYLAFRGIQNDQALLERERRERHRQIAERIAGSLHADLAQLERSLHRATSPPQGTEPADVAPNLDSLRLRNPLIQAVFFLEPDGTVRLLGPPLLFSRARESPSTAPPPGSPQASRELRSARILELRDEDYPQALAAYRRAYAEAPDTRTRGEALSAIARIQNKTGSFDDAAESYDRLLQEFGNLPMENGMPFGPAAQLELGSVLLAVGDSVGAAETLLGLFQGLVDGEWRLTEPEFDFLASRAHDILDGLLSQETPTPFIQARRDSLAHLSDEEARKRSTTERLLHFLEGGGGAISASMATLQDTTLSDRDAPENLRMTLDLRGRSYHVSVQRAVTHYETDQPGSWGILFDGNALRSDLLGSAIRRHLAPDHLGWLVKDRTGDTILASDAATAGSPTITASLANRILPYTLELYDPTPRLVETLLTTRRGVYFYAFLLLTGILVFGLSLTIRTVTNQLELARLKSDFVSTVSHEFKSPLTAIRHMTEILLADRAPSKDRRRKYYQVMLEQSERLSLLIDNVLDLSRMEEGRHDLKLERVDPGELLKDIVEAVDHRARHDGFSIQTEIETPGPILLLDVESVTQATTNLMDNAMKYSGESREVVVQGFADDTHFNVAVEDFGIGLNGEEKKRVFERFYRGGNELTRSVKGTGLGLTLVKRIAEAHGGEVIVESEPGRGSRFTIRLPMDTDAGEHDG